MIILACVNLMKRINIFSDQIIKGASSVLKSSVNQLKGIVVKNFQIFDMFGAERASLSLVAGGVGVERGGCQTILSSLEFHRKSGLGSDQVRAQTFVQILFQLESRLVTVSYCELTLKFKTVRYNIWLYFCF
jgi:hypothetical protein